MEIGNKEEEEGWHAASRDDEEARIGWGRKEGRKERGREKWIDERLII